MFPHPYTTEDAEACIELTLTGEAHQYHFVIDREGECIGAAGLIPKSDVHRKTVEIGYLEENGFEFERRHRNAVYKDGELVDKLVYGKVRP